MYRYILFVICLLCNFGCQSFVYGENRQVAESNYTSSDLPVFGQSLFLGNFSDKEFRGFNPDYIISIGDKVGIRLWGAYTFEQVLTVDPQGNIFIPHVGPVHVAGVQNGNLNDVVKKKIQKTYKSNVEVYCALDTSHPVKIFVTGFVKSPGLYEGSSSDSILSFIDRAKGIDLKSGSFVKVRVLRRGKLYKLVNLYDFLIDGQLELTPLYDGDTIVVESRKNRILSFGEVYNSFQFEFDNPHMMGKHLITLTKPLKKVNFAKIRRKSDENENTFYVPMDEFPEVLLYPEDSVEFVTDKLKETIAISVTGEHDGRQEYILPYNSQLQTLLDRVEFNRRSKVDAIQIFRESVAKEQKNLLNVSLTKLERELLTGSAVTSSQIELQQSEARLMKEFIDKARQIEPKGQIILSHNKKIGDFYLEDGDELFIPSVTNIVKVNGEVEFPISIAHKNTSIRYYIERAGGFTNDAYKRKVIVLHQDGSVAEVSTRSVPRPGDEILVMPKQRFKWFPLVKDFTQILFNSALLARALLIID